MDKEIILKEVEVLPGTISFYNYESLKNEALKLSKRVSEVVVTDENIKETKKMVSAVAKRVKELESLRIGVKKEVLAPYEDFEAKVKEIVNIVNESEEQVRNQIRELDEKARHEKEKELEIIFNKRLSTYDFAEFFGFYDFLKPEYLNKSTSFNSIEKEMVEFLEGIKKDFDVIQTMNQKERLLSFYIDTKDLTESLGLLNKENVKMEQIRKKQDVLKEEPKKEFVIVLFDEKDFKLVEMFMKSHKIKFHVPNGE